MARMKPLDLAVIQAWLSAWNECEIFSYAAVRHLQSLIMDPLWLVVVTLGVGHEPRSLVFSTHEADDTCTNSPASHSEARNYAVHGDDGRFRIRTDGNREGVRGEREGFRWQPPALPEMIVSPVVPGAPRVGQLWHPTRVISETVPKSNRVLRWDGADWVIAGLVKTIRP